MTKSQVVKLLNSNPTIRTEIAAKTTRLKLESSRSEIVLATRPSIAAAMAMNPISPDMTALIVLPVESENAADVKPIHAISANKIYASL